MQLRCNHRHKRITWIILILSHLNVTFALASVKLVSSSPDQPSASASITPWKQQQRHASIADYFFSSSTDVYPSDDGGGDITDDSSLTTLISETSSSDERSSTGTDVEYLPATRLIIPTSTHTLLRNGDESFSAPLNHVADAVPPSSAAERLYEEEPSEVLYGIQSSRSSDIEPATTTTTTAFRLSLQNETAYSDRSSAGDLSISEPTGTNLINSETTTTNLIFETRPSTTELHSATRRRTRTIPISGRTRSSAISDESIRTISLFEPTRTDFNSGTSRTELISKRTRNILISRPTRTVAIPYTSRTIPLFDTPETEPVSDRIRTVLIFEPTRTMVNSETVTENIPHFGTTRTDDEDIFSGTTNTNFNSEIFTKSVPSFERSTSTTDALSFSESTTTEQLFEPTRTNLIPETTRTNVIFENSVTDAISERSRTKPISETTETHELISESVKGDDAFSESAGTDPIFDRSRTALISESTVTDVNFETTRPDSISLGTTNAVAQATRTTRPTIAPSRTNKVIMSFDSTVTAVQSSSSSSIDFEDYQTSPLILEDEEFPLFDDSTNSTHNSSESSYTSVATESSFLILPSASFPEDARSELLLLKSTDVVLESSVSSFRLESAERESSSSIESLSSPTYFNNIPNDRSSDISPSSSSTYFAPTSSVMTSVNNNNNNVNFGRDLSTKVPENVINAEVDNKTEEVKEVNPVPAEVRPLQVHQELVLNEDPGAEHKPYLNNTVDKRFDPDSKVVETTDEPPQSVKHESNDSKTTSSLTFHRTASIVTDFKTISVTSPSHTAVLNENSSDWLLLSSIIPSSVAPSYHNISETIIIETTTYASGADFTIISPSRTILTEEPLMTKFTTLQSHNEDKSGSANPGEKQSVMPTVLIPLAYLSVSLRTSWAHLCANQFQYQKLFAKHLGVAAKASISETQIVFFNINECNQVSLNAEPDDAFDVAGTKHLYVYVRDRRGTFSKTLTQLLGNIILKLKEYGGELKDVVVGVQLHHKGDQVDQHQPQTSDTHSRDMGIVAAITISCIAGVCLMLLCVLLVVLKRRHGVQQQRRCRPVTDAYSLESISIYSSFRKRKMRASKRSYLNQGFDDPSAPTNRLNFAHLAQYTTDENAITEEYKQIPMTMAKLGEMPSGADVKNRYANVIPFPETRVLLSPNPEVNGSDYINANYVRGFQGKPKYYIACQAPLDITIIDFWQMIWENQCKVILMLTNWDENGVPKCAQYFSGSNTLDNHRLFGDYQVTTKKVDVREFYTITYLQLKNLEKNLMRDVVHHWYTGWPAQGVPTEKVSILEMLLEARASIKSNPGPTVVHCSPGTGRTGTVLAIDICMQEFETKRTVDVPRCVYHLRRDRGGLVQTTEQYLFIYEVLNEFACRALNQSGRSSVRSSR